MDVGFLGLGAMGRPMAENLAKAGHAVFAWNRSKVEAPAGVELIGSPSSVAEKARVAVVMVRDARAVESIVWGADGWAESASPDHILVQCSTVSPDDARRLATRLAGDGIRMIDAPVSGSVEPAETAQLIVLGGGEASLFDQCAPLFDSFAERTVRFGDIGAGSAVKLVVNSVLIAAIAAAAEGVTWATEEVPGLDLEKLAGVLQRISPGASKRTAALGGEPPFGGFTLELVAKDMDLATDAMGRNRVLAAVAEVCRAAVDAGLGATDLSGLGLAIRGRRGGV